MSNNEIKVEVAPFIEVREEVTLDSLIQKLYKVTAEMDNFITENVTRDPDLVNGIIRNVLTETIHYFRRN